MDDSMDDSMDGGEDKENRSSIKSTFKAATEGGGLVDRRFRFPASILFVPR
jgi:hypothetical protein